MKARKTAATAEPIFTALGEKPIRYTIHRYQVFDPTSGRWIEVTRDTLRGALARYWPAIVLRKSSGVLFSLDDLLLAQGEFEEA